ncbi:extracellular solute-binding protein [Streptomyces sp. NRRL S-1824]|uniref:extracellular solute-binding protein n=1 Tax=Streptomyces sp. NRRL S-1824 TaxID=1463889 RepID=UPI000AD5A7F7|nr:extracellular solute-binding protein [Streptomyces sp. NRRL S-1824]WSA75339.1 extracellular solute-binding protein [Streptomyces sp. NBC_01799]
MAGSGYFTEETPSMNVLTRRAMALTGAVSLTLILAACGGSGDDAGGSNSLTITANAISGGKNAAQADWIEKWVIPQFTKAQKAKGVDVKVTFRPSGVDDEQYKTKLALDLQSGSGPDVYDIDGIWVGEFAQAGYIKPLNNVVKGASSWDGWKQIPDSVQQLATFEDKLYGIPGGSDGRVIYYNKELFKQAGLPEKWQPTSWDQIIEAGEKLKSVKDVTPIQLNAGTAMGEATTMQGFLPLLAGTGESAWADGKWTGATQGVKDALNLYSEIYGDKLGDPLLQKEAKGRDKSFAEFAAGKVGMLLEGDYFWRSVINPKGGVAPMEKRDEVVGYAKIPAMTAGSGVNGQDFVSYSGGGVQTINPKSKNTDLAFELMKFMNSADAIKKQLAGEARITARTDVNDEVLAGDPMLSFVSKDVLPVTSFRPPLAEYAQVSTLLQEATAAVVDGKSPEQAAADYAKKLEGAVGGAGNIKS